MNNTISISWKEVRRFFASPGAYVLLAGSGMFFAVGLIGPQGAIALIFELTGFTPDREFPPQRLIWLVGTVRLVAVVLVPMISMRFFIEEKRNRTIEMLFTSAIRDQEIIFGKWLGGVVLYSLILAISIAELAVSYRGREHYWRPILLTHFALAVQGGGALAMGEWISAFSGHETHAAALSFLVSMAVLRYSRTGVLGVSDLAVCVALMAAGWLLTGLSIRKLRGAF